jgi:hypothetical protein
VFVRIEVLGVLAAFAISRITGRRRLLAGVPLFVLSAVLSGSRGGLVAGLIILAAFLLCSGALRSPRRLLQYTLGTALAGAAIWYLAPATVAHFIQQRFVQQTVQQGYLSDRPQIWSSAIDLAMHHPILGSGIDGFYGLVGRTQGTEYPHDFLLAVACEGGAVGLVLLSLTIALWIGALRIGVGSRLTETLSMAAAAAYILLASLFSGGYYDTRLLWLFAALAAAAASASAGSGAVAGLETTKTLVSDTPVAWQTPFEDTGHARTSQGRAPQ